MATTHAAQPWFKEPTRAQWLAFGAAWFGWVLDAFDFTVFLLAMPRIEKELGVGMLATTGSLALTYLARLAGGVLAGWVADRWGRKYPLMLSIIWFAVCDGAIALAPSFGWVLVLRTFFGFGMGAEWASGTALAMESWPARSRGIASGVLQGSWAIGYMLAGLASAYVLPHFGWRGLFVLAAVPALLVLPIRAWVPESDAWEKAHARLKDATDAAMNGERASLGKLAWGCAAMIVGFSAYNALTGAYPSMLVRELGIDDAGVGRLVFLFTSGMLLGSIGAGVLAAKRGVAIAIATPALLALPFLALYVGALPSLLGVGAFATGMFGAGFCGVTPMLLTDLFPAATRARSIGLVYHVGSSVAAFVPMLVAGIARAGHTTLSFSIACVAGASLLGIAALLLGTRAVTRGARAGAELAAPAFLGLLVALALPFSALGCASADPDPRAERAASTSSALASIEPVQSFGSNPAGLNMYRYVPQGVPANAPLVVAMHGCTQTAQDYATVGWNALADRLKFYVVYPEQTVANSPMRCFTWGGTPAAMKRGQGENLSIKQMVDKMKVDFSIDASRVFVTGLSAGGAMTAVMLAEWPDVFAAGAPIAGLPFDCAESVLDETTCMNPGKTLSAQAWGDKVRAAYAGWSGPWPRVSVWQGTSDAIVNPSNEKELAKQWAGVHGAPDAPTSTATIAGGTRAEWRDARGDLAVEMIAVSGMGHGVPVDPAGGCGTAGAFVLDEKVCSTEKIAEFFGLGGAPAAGASSGAPGVSGGAPAASGAPGAPASSGCRAAPGELDVSWALAALALLFVRLARRVRAERSTP